MEIAKVNTVEGTFYAKDANGEVRELQAGDVIKEGEVVFGDSSNTANDKVVLNLHNDVTAQVQADDAQTFDATMSATAYGDDEISFSLEAADLIARAGDEVDITSDLRDAEFEEESLQTKETDGEENPEDILDEEAAEGEEEIEGETLNLNFQFRDGNSVDVISGLRDREFINRTQDYQEEEEFKSEDENRLNTDIQGTTPSQTFETSNPSIITPPTSGPIGDNEFTPQPEVSQPEPKPQPEPEPEPEAPAQPNVLISIDDVTVNEATGKATLTVTLSKASTNALTVDYETSDATAVNAHDYTSTNGTLTFTAGETGKTIEVTITNDDIYEGSETLHVNLSNPTGGATIDKGQGIITIKDDGTGTIEGENPLDNDQPTMTIADTVTEEGSNAIFDVTLSNEAKAPYTVTFDTTVNGSAEADDITTPIVVKDSNGNEITANGDGSYTVPAGETDLSVEVPTVDDAVYEGDETFELNGKTEFMNSDTSGIGTIKDDGSAADGDDADSDADDDMPIVSIAATDNNAIEGTTNDTVIFAVTQTNLSDFDTTVDINLNLDQIEVVDITSISYTDANGNAVNLNDVTSIGNFVTNGDSVKIAAGETGAGDITITVADDAEYEVSESLNMTISNPDNAVLGTDSASATIYDEDSNNPNEANPNNIDSEGDKPPSLKMDANHKVEFFDSDTVEVVEGKLEITTNLVVTLDVSGSMGSGRLDLAKESLEAVINQYKAEGTTKVNLTTFSSDATNHGWMNADDAIAAINGLSAGGWTNYEGAIKETTQNVDFTGHEASRTLSFFISDGDPTQELDGSGNPSDDTSTSNVMDSLDATAGATIDGVTYGRVDQQYYDMWKNFTTDQTNGVETTTIGLGDGLSSDGKQYLDMMADAYEGEALFVEDSVDELTAALSPEETIEGNVFDFVEAYSDLSIEAITIDGVEYNQTVTDEAIDGKGQFGIDFDTGEYSYSIKKNEFDADSVQTFGVKVSDANNNELDFDVDMHVFTFHPTITGDANDNEITYNPTAIIDGDDGDDTLVLLDEQGIDFSDEVLEVATIDNIETIAMDNTSANSLTNLTLDDVVDMTDNDNEIAITGDNDDSVEVDTSGWSEDSTVDNGDTTTHTYSKDGDTVKITVDDDIGTINGL